MWFSYLFVEGIVCFFLAFPFITMFISTFVTKKINPDNNNAGKEFDFACIITAYKDASITLNLVKSLQAQSHSNYLIYLVADNCDMSNLELNSEKLIVLQPSQPLNSKVKSIAYGIENFQRNHEAIMIFDPDNLAHPDCLYEVNSYFQAGYKAVQGRRTAKNLDTFYACLDAVGEFYYNYSQRLVPFKLGSSATIAGSGMAFISKYYIDFLNNDAISNAHLSNKVIVAEDKMLQVDFVGKGNIIAYAENAIVYDEKVSSGKQVERQRTRWINSYFLHLKDGLALLWMGITKLSFNRIFFAYTIIIPPMFILVLLTFILLLVNIFFSFPHFIIVFISFALFVSGFMFALYLSKVPIQIWQSLWRIPFFMVRQLLALLKINNSNKDFMVTEKTKNSSVEDVMSLSK